MDRWTTSVLAQNRTVIPALAGPSQNCRCAIHMFPDGGTTYAHTASRPHPARNAALIALASDLPVDVLSSLLGISTSAALHWTRRAGRDWTTYPASRAGIN